MTKSIIIHVHDDQAKVQKDFECNRDVLLRHMKYFEQYLSQSKDGPTGPELDISVHCDLQIFSWLVQFMHSTLPSTSPEATKVPELTVENALSILISAEFLQMDTLLEISIKFVCEKLLKIIELNVDLFSLSETALSKIASESSEYTLRHLTMPSAEPQSLSAAVKKHRSARNLKFQEALYKFRYRKLVKTTLALPSRAHDRISPVISLCRICHIVYPTAFAAELHCSGSPASPNIANKVTERQNPHLVVEFHGAATYVHQRDENFNAELYLENLEPTPTKPSSSSTTGTSQRRRLKTSGMPEQLKNPAAAPEVTFTWKELYHYSYSLVHCLRCSQCSEVFNGLAFEECRHHRGKPIGVRCQLIPRADTTKQDTFGYSCCNLPVFALSRPTSLSQGCTSRSHQLDNPTEKQELMYQVFHFFNEQTSGAFGAKLEAIIPRAVALATKTAHVDTFEAEEVEVATPAQLQALAKDAFEECLRQSMDPPRETQLMLQQLENQKPPDSATNREPEENQRKYRQQWALDHQQEQDRLKMQELSKLFVNFIAQENSSR